LEMGGNSLQSKKMYVVFLCFAAKLGVVQATTSLSGNNPFNVNPFTPYTERTNWMGRSFGGPPYMPGNISPEQTQQIWAIVQQGGFSPNHLPDLLANLERLVASSFGNRPNFAHVVSWLRQQGLNENSSLQVAQIVLQAENALLYGHRSFTPPSHTFSPPVVPSVQVDMNSLISEQHVEWLIRYFRERGAPQPDLDHLSSLLNEFLRQGTRTYSTLMEFLRFRGLPAVIQDALYGALSYVSSSSNAGTFVPPSNNNVLGMQLVSWQTIDQLLHMLPQAGMVESDVQRVRPLIEQVRQRIGSGLTVPEFIRMLRQVGVQDHLLDQISVLFQRILIDGSGSNASSEGFGTDQVNTLSQIAQNPLASQNYAILQELLQRILRSGMPSDYLQRWQEAIQNVHNCVSERIRSNNPQSCPPPSSSTHLNSLVNEQHIELFIRFFRDRGTPQVDLDRLRSFLDEFMRQGARTYSTLIEFLRSRGTPGHIMDAMFDAWSFVSNNGIYSSPGQHGNIISAGNQLVTLQTIDEMVRMMQQSGISESDSQRLTPFIQSLQQRIGTGLPTSECISIMRQMGAPENLLDQLSILLQRILGSIPTTTGVFSTDQIIELLNRVVHNPLAPENVRLLQDLKQRVQDSRFPVDIIQRCRESIENVQNCVAERTNSRNAQSCPAPPALPTGITCPATASALQSIQTTIQPARMKSASSRASTNYALGSFIAVLSLYSFSS
jgi:hypothetical protein